MSPVSEARRRANEKYNAKVYEEIKVRVSKGKKETIQSHADAQGQSVNSFINSAIDRMMNQDTAEAPQTPLIQSNESEGGYYNAELFEAVLEAVKQYGGDLSKFIDDAITAYLKSYPSIMKLKRMEAELYAAQEEARKRFGVEEPEEPEKQEDSFANLSTGEVVEKFMQVGELRKLNLKTTEN